MGSVVDQRPPWDKRVLGYVLSVSCEQYGVSLLCESGKTLVRVGAHSRCPVRSGRMGRRGASMEEAAVGVRGIVVSGCARGWANQTY